MRESKDRDDNRSISIGNVVFGCERRKRWRSVDYERDDTWSGTCNRSRISREVKAG